MFSWSTIRNCVKLSSSIRKKHSGKTSCESNNKTSRKVIRKICDPDVCLIEPSNPQPKVVIIGAGMAGLSAASRLAKCGLKNFTILEAKGRPGGRIHSCHLKSGEVTELGAQWIEGGMANPIYSLACMKNIEGKLSGPSQPVTAPFTVFLTEDGRAIDEETVKIGTNLFNEIKEKAISIFSLGLETKKSLKEFLALQLQKELNCISEEIRYDVTRVVYSYINCLKARWGMDASKLSADQYGSFTSIPGTSLWVKSGLVGILDVILNEIPKDSIKFCKPVKNINWEDDSAPIQINCCDGECFTADFCLVTVSLGVLKKFGFEMFTPELPLEKQEAINRLGFGYVEKIFLAYEKAFWGKGEGSLRLAWPAQELDKTSRHWNKGITSINELQTSKNVLVVMVAGEEALTMQSWTDEEIAEELTFTLRQFTGDPTLPRPIEILKTRWSTDPHFNGSMSYIGESSSILDQCFIGDPIVGGETEFEKRPRILFAGEATYPGGLGTLQGARASGLREAERILKIARCYRYSPANPKCISKNISEPEQNQLGLRNK